MSLSSSGGTRISLPDWMVGLWRWARRLGVRGRRVEHTDPQKGGGTAAAQDFDGQFWLQGSDSGRQAGVLRVGPDLTPSVGTVGPLISSWREIRRPEHSDGLIAVTQGFAEEVLRWRRRSTP